MSEYATTKKLDKLPRIPLEGHIDLTYRCNNNCLHCWLWRPTNAPEQKDELTFDEIKNIVDQARAMGTRRWSISGGEPMLRPDFPEIFEYITSKAISYSLNTNGTLITPAIAQQLKRKGNKMIALYGATAETYDKVTRHPGGFEMAMRGFRYMQEAGAGFTVQLIPMKANWHEWEQMKVLAKSFSAHTRIGAAWLFMSAYSDPIKNAEISSQRLDPKIVIELDLPTMSQRDNYEHKSDCNGNDDHLFSSCIASRQEFSIDPFGRMTFCSLIKNPSMIYNLREGLLQDAWDNFIPSLADKVLCGAEYFDNCGSCEKIADCRWCGVIGYLEHGSYSAPIEYLCAIADERIRYKQDWVKNHCRFFQIAGITIKVESDLDFNDIKFPREFSPFMVAGPGDDNVSFRHYFYIPEIFHENLGKEIYSKAPWVINKSKDSWIYQGISIQENNHTIHRFARFSYDYSKATIYHLPEVKNYIQNKGWYSLSLFPTDQIWLATLLADRNAALLHSSSVIINGKGLIFVGHSSAGKTTTIRLLRKAIKQHELSTPIEILCDDRNIIRRWDEEWRVHGTWSHGDIAKVSSASAPLQAVLFLEKGSENKIQPMMNKKEIWRRLLGTIIKPMVTNAWWQEEMDILGKFIDEVPAFTMYFDKTGLIVPEIEKLVIN